MKRLNHGMLLKLIAGPQFAHMILLVLSESVADCDVSGFGLQCSILSWAFACSLTSCLIVRRDWTWGQRMPKKDDRVVWLRFKTPESQIPSLH
jgi:hypothetical protein